MRRLALDKILASLDKILVQLETYQGQASSEMNSINDAIAKLEARAVVVEADVNRAAKVAENLRNLLVK